MNHLDLYIYNLHLDGRSARYIIKTLRVGYLRIKSAIISFQNPKYLSHQKGGPKIINEQIIRLVESLTLEDASLSDKNCSLKIYSILQVKIDSTTINRICHLLKFNWKPPRIIQKLSEEQIQLRLEFVNDIHTGNICSRNILFSDESRFSICNGSKRALTRYGEFNRSSRIEKEKYEVTVMI